MQEGIVMNHGLKAAIATMAILGACAPAQAQRYFARQRLNSSAPAAAAPTKTPTATCTSLGNRTYVTSTGTGVKLVGRYETRALAVIECQKGAAEFYSAVTVANTAYGCNVAGVYGVFELTKTTGYKSEIITMTDMSAGYDGLEAYTCTLD
jgi:hypothetical protein